MELYFQIFFNKIHVLCKNNLFIRNIFVRTKTKLFSSPLFKGKLFFSVSKQNTIDEYCNSSFCSKHFAVSSCFVLTFGEFIFAVQDTEANPLTAAKFLSSSFINFPFEALVVSSSSARMMFLCQV